MSKPSFLSSLFSISLSLNVSHLAIELGGKEKSRKPSYFIYAVNKLSGDYHVVGKLSGASLFNELRRAGVDIDTTEQSSSMRLRTDWNAQGVRYQSRVSFYPESRIRLSSEVGAGVIRFDNMRVYVQTADEAKAAQTTPFKLQRV